MHTAADMLASGFATLPDLIAAHARERGDRIALADEATTLDYAALDRRMGGIDALPRSAIGKVLKRDLRERLEALA